MITIVVAHAANGVIGRDGHLPWRLPTDMRRFRELTVGHVVLMGRRTFQSLPDAFRPLPDRRNLVLSRDPGCRAPGAEVFADLPAALAACRGECFVIGGEVTYRATLALARRIHATEVEGEPAGDVCFPTLAPREWARVQRSEPIAENGQRFTFNVYERTTAAAV